MALTGKQQRFVEEYLVDMNATQAAIRAGYSEKTARNIGCENVTKPDIQAAIAKSRQEQVKHTGIDAAWVIERLVVEADGDRANDRIKSLELLGKTIPLFTDKVRVDGELPTIKVEYTGGD